VQRRGSVRRAGPLTYSLALTINLVSPTNTTVRPARIVMDTNVLVAALRSRRGAVFKLLTLVGRGHFDSALSVPLVLEYEAAAKRRARDGAVRATSMTSWTISAQWAIGSRSSSSGGHSSRIRGMTWCVEAECEYIVTYDQRDFAGAERFGVRIVTPREFLQERGLLR
jgi:predicted nucleic acid-binding protein